MRRRTEMLKAREILKLSYESSLSIRDISSSTGVGKSTVSEIINRAIERKVNVNITAVVFLFMFNPSIICQISLLSVSLFKISVLQFGA